MIKLDRILVDILGWLQRAFWESPDKREADYRILETHTDDSKGCLSKQGILHEIERPLELSPRAVATWIFMPKRGDLGPKESARVLDTLICLDHLGKLERDQLKEAAGIKYGRAPETHKVTVMKVSHWRQKAGEYENIHQLYSGFWDLQVDQSDRDEIAKRAIRIVAKLLLDRPILKGEWGIEIKSAFIKAMRGARRPSRW